MRNDFMRMQVYDSCIPTLRLGISAMEAEGKMSSGAVDAVPCNAISRHLQNDDVSQCKKDTDNGGGDERYCGGNWSPKADVKVDTETMFSVMETEGKIDSCSLWRGLRR